MVTVLVRIEKPGDAAAIRCLLNSSFPSEGEAQLVEALRRHGQLVVSLVADAEGPLVGHVAFSPVSTAAGAVGLGLAPLAVAKPHQGQGIGTKLIETGLEAARQAGYHWVVVLGEPAFYRRFGFLPAASRCLADAYGGADAFQVLELQPGGLPLHGGLVSYAPELGLLG